MQEVELISRFVLQVDLGLLWDVLISWSFAISKLFSCIEQHLAMDLNLVDGLDLFLDVNKGSVGFNANLFDIVVRDHDIQVHVVGNEAVCYEVVVVFHAKMVESLQALAHLLRY